MWKIGKTRVIMDYTVLISLRAAAHVKNQTSDAAKNGFAVIIFESGSTRAGRNRLPVLNGRGRYMKRKRLNFTTRYVLVFGLLMLIANMVLGLIILYQSESALKSLINKNMMDVVETAAALMDGDTLTALTEEDVDGEVFREIKDRLLVFQNHADIKYIYTIKQAADDRYVFVVDPDPVDPGQFGEDTVVTDAMIQAGKGTASVDNAPLADRWGNYYSAFCPVFDSRGKVAAVVGIDFDADWYKAQLREYSLSIALTTLLTVLIGGTVVFLITHNVRKRFGLLDEELAKLSSIVDQLMEGAGSDSDSTGPADAESSEDEIEKLASRIQSLQKDMAVYERLQKDLYYNDSITGIPNLIFVKQFADERIHKLRASGITPAVVYFDLRSMNSYNTEYGYSRGDELLKLTAETIRETFPDALVGRGEGDHFIVIDAYDEDIRVKAHQINETVKKGAYGRTTGIQCAIVKMESDIKAVEGIQRARVTLKKIGDDLNIVCREYSSDEDAEYLTSRYVLQHFDEAMKKAWIKVYYQPILRTGTKRISALEALARWEDPVRGMISPGQFIPVLSRYHQLHKLALYMAAQICREFRIRNETGLPLIPVSINFSGQDFDYINVANMLNRTLDKFKLPRSSIIVEITEEDLAQATDQFVAQLQKIHDSGYQLWLDDFGSGYSSLNVFSKYHIDRIKFDMDLIRHLDDNNGVNRIIMKSVVEMCRQMGILALAEGIETEEQYQFLKEIDCELVQGFYFFRPGSLETTIPIIRDHGDQVLDEMQEECRK